MSDQDYQPRADLLAPILDDERPPEPLYSARAEFFTAFFGGPFAILILSSLNARILGRLNKDMWRYVLGAIIALCAVVGVTWLGMTDAPPQWYAEFVGDQGSRATRWISRGFALILWAALWWPYRRYHKAAELMGIGPRSPWAAAIASGVIGLGLGFVIIYLVTGYMQPQL